MTTFQRLEFDNYIITVEKLPEEEQPDKTDFYDKTYFYGRYIHPVYLQFSKYANKNGLKLKYSGYLDTALASVFYFKLDYELRKIRLHKRGYALDWFFSFHFKNMGKFSEGFVRDLESGIITWESVIKLAQSKRFINSVIKECKFLLVKKDDSEGAEK